jgi:hypothetical protein
MRDIVWVDGSPCTVAALLRHGIRSPRTVACPLHMSSKSVPYCHRPTVSMSCTHLMPAIHYVWPVTYAFNALPGPWAWRGHDEPDVRRLENARARPEAESHWARGGSGALLHQEAGLEPLDTWRHRSLAERWSWCLGHVAAPEPSYVGGGPGAARHMATPEPSPVGCRDRCLGARGNIGDLS